MARTLIFGGVFCAAATVSFALYGADATYTQLAVFARAFNAIQQHYVERITPERLVERAITGMVKDLDQTSEYVPAETFKRLRGDSKDSVAHGGLATSCDTGVVRIAALLPDGPAERAGLLLGDIVKAVDDSATSCPTASPRFGFPKAEGAPNSKLKLTIDRPGFLVPRYFTLVRQPLPDISVFSQRKGDVIVVTVKRFSDGASRMLANAIVRERGKPYSGVVVDLRDNPGGFVTEAVRMVDFFVDKGDIVSTLGRDGEVIEAYQATAIVKAETAPVVVLVNKHSASAAEIVAGALQDLGRAQIVGERTFGKASVQTIIELEDGSALKLTTAHYYTPKKRMIDKQGIEPQIALSDVPEEQWVARAAEVIKH
ncbi:MAG: S41 family peptidase [Deltaproteobacteria bacterium]|nr:S41 family peptidase [Deltaproteobacteria bacterium]